MKKSILLLGALPLALSLFMTAADDKKPVNPPRPIIVLRPNLPQLPAPPPGCPHPTRLADSPAVQELL